MRNAKDRWQTRYSRRIDQSITGILRIRLFSRPSRGTSHRVLTVSSTTATPKGIAKYRRAAFKIRIPGPPPLADYSSISK